MDDETLQKMFWPINELRKANLVIPGSDAAAKAFKEFEHAWTELSEAISTPGTRPGAELLRDAENLSAKAEAVWELAERDEIVIFYGTPEEVAEVKAKLQAYKKSPQR